MTPIELRVLSSSDVKLVKLESKQQRFDRSRRGAYPATSLGGPAISCRSAIVESALPGTAKLILNHTDSFHVMGVDVMPCPDINRKDTGLDEFCRSTKDMLSTGSLHGYGSAVWGKMRGSSADDNRVHDILTITIHNNSRQIRIPNHGEKKTGNDCEDWSRVAAVLAGDSGAPPRVRFD
ncbi:hypothetical protein NDU88_009875 [Pleurodeles waltl]|uniref:Uncharacterized protein n=1 Tax=Pleurodeles waltl TaxID=8319 RepID=A0AAV7PX77_PLEWA|nr:hypothetical protein NDU88_009875 [Pleurodeles waltl]